MVSQEIEALMESDPVPLLHTGAALSSRPLLSDIGKHQGAISEQQTLLPPHARPLGGQWRPEDPVALSKPQRRMLQFLLPGVARAVGNWAETVCFLSQGLVYAAGLQSFCLQSGRFLLMSPSPFSGAKASTENNL